MIQETVGSNGNAFTGWDTQQNNTRIEYSTDFLSNGGHFDTTYMGQQVAAAETMQQQQQQQFQNIQPYQYQLEEQQQNMHFPPQQIQPLQQQQLIEQSMYVQRSISWEISNFEALIENMRNNPNNNNQAYQGRGTAGQRREFTEESYDDGIKSEACDETDSPTAPSTPENSKSNDETDHLSDNLIPTSQEAFSYLIGLNSDNLMRFSQQSEIQELLVKDQLPADDKLPSLDVLPTLEEHDIGGYKFQMSLSQNRKARFRWVFSEELNKIYIKMNDVFTMDAVFTPKVPAQQLRIRAMVCFVKDLSEPVLRCQNHMSKEIDIDQRTRQSILRCENPLTEYCGVPEGKSIKDRLGVLIPLNVSVKPNSGTVKQTIALKLTCQNSCIGRKETSLVFILESGNGEILSQRVIDIKVCSCPRRDKVIDERNLPSRKHKMDEDDGLNPKSAKICKNDNNSSLGTVVKHKHNEEGNLLTELPKQYDLQPTASGGYRLVVELPNKEIAADCIETTMNKMAAKSFFDAKSRAQYAPYIRSIKRLLDKTQT